MGDLIGNKIADKITSVPKKSNNNNIIIIIIIIIIIMKMQKQLFLKKDTQPQKKDGKLLMNQGQYLKKMSIFKNY